MHAITIPEGDGPLADSVTAHPAHLIDSGQLAAVAAEVRPDVVVHLAGAASVGRSFEEPEDTWRVNVMGTLAILEAIRRACRGARAIVITSGEIYGRVAAEDLPVDVDTPLRPLSPYAASKAAADIMAGQYAQNFDLDVIRVRPFNQIGPGQDARFVVPSIAKQIADAEARGATEVTLSLGNLGTRRDFTDVRDTARAYRMIMEDGRPGAIYHPCSGFSRAIGDLVDALIAATDLTVRVSSDAGRRRAGEQPDLYGSHALLHQHFGWSPEIELEVTMTDILNWWRARAGDTT